MSPLRARGIPHTPAEAHNQAVGFAQYQMEQQEQHEQVLKEPDAGLKSEETQKDATWLAKGQLGEKPEAQRASKPSDLTTSKAGDLKSEAEKKLDEKMPDKSEVKESPSRFFT